MRKKITVALLGVLIILAMAIVVVTAGCGAQFGAQAAPTQSSPTDAQGILQQALASTEKITSGTGDFTLTVKVTPDPNQPPSGVEALLSQPITLDGTYSLSTNPEALDIEATASLAGQNNIAIGLKAVNEQAWVQFMGQWYQLPAEMMQQATGTTGTTNEMDVAGLLQALANAGVDPTTWLTNLTVVGQEDLHGTNTYHLSGTVDVNKIVTDAMKLMQDPNIQKLLPSIMGQTGTTAGSTDTSITLPSEQELQSLQSELGKIMQNVTLDMWITTDTYQFRQVALNATVTPPADQNMGIGNIAVQATISLTPSTTPVTVTPPTNVQPFSALEQQLQALQSIFSGALGGGTSTSTTGQ